MHRPNPIFPTEIITKNPGLVNHGVHMSLAAKKLRRGYLKKEHDNGQKLSQPDLSKILLYGNLLVVNEELKTYVVE